MQTHERIFYEVAWRTWARGQPMPLPWWLQQCFRRWIDEYDSGLFDSKEAALASNALYRYWNIVGVKDHHQESLVGQAGEIEPVYDKYSVSFFVFDPSSKALHFPQSPEPDAGGPAIRQELEDGYLPVLITKYRPPALGVQVEEKVIGTVVGARQRSVVLARFAVAATAPLPRAGWLCLLVSPTGPSGFQRHDRAGRYLADRRINFVKYIGDEGRLEVSSAWGPIFDGRPTHFGCYGNPGSVQDPDHYLEDNPFEDLRRDGSLNGLDLAIDSVAGMCSAVFAWPFNLTPAAPTFLIDVKLPVDDYRGSDDLQELQVAAPDLLENGNRSFWKGKLDGDGVQVKLPGPVHHLFDLFRSCRATMLILADEGQIHPGPTIYDSFWVRDSSVEGVACALNGDGGLAGRQFGEHYPRVFNLDDERLGDVNLRGFFGGEHEKNDREWDSNGQALWALGRFDRILGPDATFGARMFSPYIVDGARWIRDNRTRFGLLPSGWSAEHLGEKDKPHYWDDLWGVAGLYEAARLAERLRVPETPELWGAYEELRQATRNSIRWVLGEQRRQGHWETFIPTGPADVGRLDSTIIGALAYFHPCRLHMGAKLGDDIDLAARLTLDTIWAHFIEGGFRHDTAWGAYGPYLTLQLAHAFLLVGDLNRMDRCLEWSVGNAAYPRASRNDGDDSHPWQVALGAWNEQHCYPIATNFAKVPNRWWYMGDIPHGWAAAEFTLLLRDILFFEADEDGERHIFLAPGILPHWVGDGEEVALSDAPTIFGGRFGYRLRHDAGARRVDLEILQTPPADVAFVYPCPFGSDIAAASADGQAIPAHGRAVRLPPGVRRATVSYR